MTNWEPPTARRPPPPPAPAGLSPAAAAAVGQAVGCCGLVRAIPSVLIPAVIRRRFASVTVNPLLLHCTRTLLPTVLLEALLPGRTEPVPFETVALGTVSTVHGHADGQ